MPSWCQYKLKHFPIYLNYNCELYFSKLKFSMKASKFSFEVKKIHSLRKMITVYGKKKKVGVSSSHKLLLSIRTNVFLMFAIYLNFNYIGVYKKIYIKNGRINCLHVTCKL